MSTRLALVVCLLALAAPPAALAQGGPFGSGPAGTPVQTNPAPAPSSASTSDGGGLSGWAQVLLFGGGAVLLGGIAWAVVADARRSAPVEESVGQAEARARREDEHRRRKAKARAGGKRARAARKRNRAR